MQCSSYAPCSDPFFLVSFSLLHLVPVDCAMYMQACSSGATSTSLSEGDSPGYAKAPGSERVMTSDASGQAQQLPRRVTFSPSRSVVHIAPEQDDPDVAARSSVSSDRSTQSSCATSEYTGIDSSCDGSVSDFEIAAANPGLGRSPRKQDSGKGRGPRGPRKWLMTLWGCFGCTRPPRVID